VPSRDDLGRGGAAGMVATRVFRSPGLRAPPSV
jgi:hypothetical protein